jgi:energy-coupling factor transporter ATP-binding protein EcfA2
MDAFLRLVTPVGGFKFLATPNEHGRGFSHTAFTDIEHMAISAVEFDEEHQDNVYFALAGFRAEWVDGVNAQGNKVRQHRTHDNVEWLRALWVDLDVDADSPKKYASQGEAVTDLVRFCRAAMLPVPTIVNSGGGIHAYWPLDRDIPRASWKTLATMFKQVTVALGLKADQTRTADESSVLRVPGTHNRKPGKGVRPVALVGQLTQPIDVVELAKAVRTAFDACGASMPKVAEPKVEVTGINADLMGGVEQAEPAHFGKIIARCPQVAAVANARGNVEEPLWYSTLGLVRHCIDAERIAHDVSDGHPGYSAAATDRKMQQLVAKDVGPTTCARYDALNPGVCATCPHFGKVTSPIQLGKDDEVVAAPAELITIQGVEFQLPDAPAPYVRTAAGQVVMMQNDEDGNPLTPLVIYRYDLYPISRHYDEFERRHHTRFRTYQPKRGWYEFDVPNEVLYDLRALSKTLANNDVLPDIGAVKYMGDYIVSYAQELQKIADSANLFMQMGWREGDTKFVLGSRVISAEGVQEVTASAISAKAAEKFDKAGTLEGWKGIVSFYSTPGYEPLLFGFLTAFGAPLFKFTGFHGAILNMMGASGTGKSTALKAMNTVYGAPDCAHFQLMDTEKSFYRRVGVLNNLPVGYDEITNIDSKRLSDLCYDFTQGRERMRLTSGATERRDTFYWSTIMLSTANASLHSRLAMAKGDASAESVRVFEYDVPTMNGGDALELKRRFDGLTSNYGHAGDIYLQYVAANLETVKASLTETTDRIYTEAKLPSSERFWAAIIAANLVGGTIANQLGLVTVDIPRLMRWAMGRIEVMRGAVQEYRRSPVDTMSDWLARLTPNTLVVTGRPDNPFAHASIILPKNELKARFDRTAGKVYIAQSVIQEFCKHDGVDFTALRRELTGMGVLLEPERKVLGAGTEFQTGQTRCWVVNANSALMVDAATDAATKAAADGVVAPFRQRR